jgi:hypothetical protein
MKRAFFNLSGLKVPLPVKSDGSFASNEKMINKKVCTLHTLESQ